jgi:protein-disulfide isomerase
LVLGLVPCFVMSVAGCNEPAPAAKPKVSPKACEDYSKRLCKETGDESPTCASIKTATELMPAEACAIALANVDGAIKQLGSKKAKCTELQDRLCKDIGPETQSCAMVKANIANPQAFPPERCEMMLGRYADVLADLKRQEDKNKPLTPEKVAKLIEGDTASFGPKTAKVTIVEFSDFECPFCSKAAHAVEELRGKYGDKIHFVFRQFPLSFHANAHVAAQASLAAKEQGKFWQFHDKLFADQKKLDRASLEAAAKELGLDVAKFKKALDDKKFAATVDAELKLGEEVAVDGTPTMFLNGTRVPNPSDVAAVSQQIDAALKAAGG